MGNIGDEPVREIELEPLPKHAPAEPPAPAPEPVKEPERIPA